jgi:hypothetical protein
MDRLRLPARAESSIRITAHRIVAKPGAADISVAPGEQTVSKDPLPESGYPGDPRAHRTSFTLPSAMLNWNQTELLVSPPAIQS